MGSRGNLNTLRKLFNWNSTWYNKNSYKQLIFRDLVIDVYLTGLFYKLRIASSYFFIKNSFFSIYIIECDLYLTQRKKLLSLFFNYKEFVILLRLFYTFLKTKSLPKVKTRATSKRGSLLHNKNYFVKASLYCRTFLLSTLCVYYFLIYNLRSMLIVDTMFEDLDKTTKYSLNLFSIKSTTGLLYATYHIANTYSDPVTAFNSTISERKLFTETLYFIKYTSKNLCFLDGCSPIVSNCNIQFLFSFIGTQHLQTVSYKITTNIKKTISTIRTFKNEPFYRYHLLFYIISKLSRLIIKHAGSLTIIKLLHRKIHQLGNLIVGAFCVQKNSTVQRTTTLKYTAMLLSFVQSCQTSDNVLFSENIFFFYYASICSWLSTRIEHTLINYTGSNYLFRPTVYLNYRPFITNSKILGEYISLSLSGGDTVNNVFKSVQHWIEEQHTFLEYRGATEFKNRVLNSSYLPLKGVRIICKGPTSIARRKRKVTFHTWVSNNNITGKMPVQSLSVQVDFYQTFAVMPQASVGIKVWTLFEFIENC